MGAAVRWRDYSGLSAAELERVLTDVLAGMKIGRKSRVAANPAETMMLGSGPEVTAGRL